MRKILINHIEHGEKLPFFLNLSTIQHESIKSELLNLMERIGLSLDEKKMDALLKSEKIIVFLDGFDELPIAKRDGILKEVMKLNEDFSLQLITTSRPDTKICDTAGIIQYKVSSLDFSDILEIVKKSGVNLDIKAVERSLSLNRRFADSLNTPILVVLFIKCFPFMNIIPNDTIDFYKSIFDVMYETHDKAKRFLDRDKRIKDITRTVSYDFFCALCFVSLFDEITSFSEKQLEDKLMEAMELVDPEFIKRGVSQRKYANDFMHDLIDITSLIAKDSDDSYIYSHKSIQEFHAAEFIKNQPSSNNAKLEYCQIITRSLLDSEIMLSAIDFLTKIDKTDSINYILKPYCESLNFEVQGGDIIASNEALDNYIDHQFKDTFIAFMPKGKFGDVRDMGIEHITKASKKDGRVIIGPTSEFLPIFNVFSINLKDDYISDLINKIAISKSTINYLMTKNKFEKMPIVVYFKNLSEGEKQEIRSNIRIKINDFCRVYFKDEYNKITKKRTTFMERYKK
ncbi:NACHT domain-containing protein [Dryocola sp. BD586]|uniref:NACHT domain-containing protein n=1 Tax=Dryocola sp. BD586 TaxID=3133271 RepID=UPI003F50256A